jgi:mannose-6-phosphate isomerase-like protein (cupin superfamily)
MSETKTAWISKSSASSKPWGDETSWTGTHSASVKTLTLAAGKRNSFKYNRTKDEMLICGSGKVKVYFGDEELITKSRGDLQEGYLEPGYALIVQSHCPYRLEAVEDSVILEVSSKSEVRPSRLHDDYGREVEECNEYVQGIIDKWFPT